MSLNYIYIIQTKESIDKNDNVYKVGMTKCGPKNRVSSYGTNSRLISLIEVKCAKTTEREILEELKKHFQQDRSYGIEYFKVYDIHKLLTIVTAICNKNLVSDKLDSYVNIEPLEQILNLQGFTNKKDLLKNYNTINISKYTCVRCGHGASQLGDLRKHLNKAKECFGYFNNTDREVLLEMLNNSKDYINYLQTNFPKNLKTLVKPIENNATELPKTTHQSIIHRCYKCSRQFSCRQSRWYHEKHCKEEIQVNTDNIDSNDILNKNNNIINNNINFSKLCILGQEATQSIDTLLVIDLQQQQKQKLLYK